MGAKEPRDKVEDEFVHEGESPQTINMEDLRQNELNHAGPMETFENQVMTADEEGKKVNEGREEKEAEANEAKENDWNKMDQVMPIQRRHSGIQPWRCLRAEAVLE